MYMYILEYAEPPRPLCVTGRRAQQIHLCDGALHIYATAGAFCACIRADSRPETLHGNHINTPASPQDRSSLCTSCLPRIRRHAWHVWGKQPRPGSFHKLVVHGALAVICHQNHYIDVWQGSEMQRVRWGSQGEQHGVWFI